jgi:hypothetical protein
VTSVDGPYRFREYEHTFSFNLAWKALSLSWPWTWPSRPPGVAKILPLRFWNCEGGTLEASTHIISDQLAIFSR